jgi:hypothetical protein
MLVFDCTRHLVNVVCSLTNITSVDPKKGNCDFFNEQHAGRSWSLQRVSGKLLDEILFAFPNAGNGGLNISSPRLHADGSRMVFVVTIYE